MNAAIRSSEQDHCPLPPAFVTTPGTPRQPRLIHAVILLVTAGLSSLATAVLGPTLPRMQVHFVATPHADYLVPLSLTVPMLMMALLSVFSGLLADRVGRKRILVVATVGYALCGTAPLYLDSLNAILASRILLGVAEAMVMTVSTTLIGDYFNGTRRAKMMSLHTTFAAISAFILNIVGGILGNHGWRTPYWVYGISLVLALLMAIHLWEPNTGRSMQNPQVDPVVADEGPFRLRQLVGICVVAAVVGVTFLTVPVHLGYLFALLHVTDSAQIGLAFALNSVGVILGSVAFGWVIGPRVRSVALQIALASGVLAIGFVGMSASANPGSLTIASTLSGVGMGLLLPTVNVWNMQVLPVSHRGVGIGAFQSSLFLGMFFNPILVVSLDQWSHSRAVSVGWMGLPLLLAAGVSVLVAVRARATSALSPSDA